HNIVLPSGIYQKRLTSAKSKDTWNILARPTLWKNSQTLQPKYKVQAVQILNNSNSNKARRAYIYFSSEQDKKAPKIQVYITLKKTIKNNKRKPILKEMEQFKKIKPNNLSKQLNDDNRANYRDLNDNKENHIHTYREPFKRLENISKSNHK
ncbi:4296_t:CDS:2, partial [Gigaspora rosea]